MTTNLKNFPNWQKLLFFLPKTQTYKILNRSHTFCHNTQVFLAYNFLLSASQPLRDEHSLCFIGNIFNVGEFRQGTLNSRHSRHFVVKEIFGKMFVHPFTHQNCFTTITFRWLGTMWELKCEIILAKKYCVLDTRLKY